MAGQTTAGDPALGSERGWDGPDGLGVQLTLALNQGLGKLSYHNPVLDKKERMAG